MGDGIFEKNKVREGNTGLFLIARENGVCGVFFVVIEKL